MCLFGMEAFWASLSKVEHWVEPQHRRWVAETQKECYIRYVAKVLCRKLLLTTSAGENAGAILSYSNNNQVGYGQYYRYAPPVRCTRALVYRAPQLLYTYVGTTSPSTRALVYFYMQRQNSYFIIQEQQTFFITQKSKRHSRCRKSELK